MYAVIKTGGKQYMVTEGDVLRVEKLDGEAGDSITFEEILLLSEADGSKAVVGTPMVAGATVAASLVAQGRAKKIEVAKFKAKSRYYKRAGHRQPYTEVKIEKIAAK